MTAVSPIVLLLLAVAAAVAVLGGIAATGRLGDGLEMAPGRAPRPGARCPETRESVLDVSDPEQRSAPRPKT